MKRTFALTLAFTLLTLGSAFAQQEEAPFTIGDSKVGLSLGTSARYTTLFDEDAGLLELKGLLTFNRTWAVGLTGSALWYDKELHSLVDDGSYRMEMAYGGMVVERWFSLSQDLIFSVSVATGYGEVKYRYDKEYRKDKIWTEETIDQTTFAFFEPGIAMQWNISGRLWLGVAGSYRNTSPVELLGTDEDVFRKFNGGLTLTYGLF